MSHDVAEFYVYEHWRTDTSSCFYVGKGRRKRAYNLNRKGHHGNIIRKLLRDGFNAEVRFVAVDLCEDQAFDFEKRQIAYWRSLGVLLTNLTDGGEGVSNPSEEVRNKMRAALIGNKRSAGRRISDAQREKMIAGGRTEQARANRRTARLGFKLSTEARSKISRANSGKVPSAETRIKLSNALKGKSKPEGFGAKLSVVQKGKVLSEDSRKKLSVANTGKRASALTRAKMSEARLGVPRPQSFVSKMTGRMNTDATKQKMREAALLREAKKRLINTQG